MGVSLAIPEKINLGNLASSKSEEKLEEDMEEHSHLCFMDGWKRNKACSEGKTLQIARVKNKCIKNLLV